METIQQLKRFLDREIKRNEQKILVNIERFISSQDDYWNTKYSNFLQGIIKKGGNEKLKTIGFPFPLLSYPLEFQKNFEDISINLCLRGKPLRDLQRNQLVEEFKQKTNILFIEIEDITKFRELTKQLCVKYNFCSYFDPYSFIGDSFIGLHFIETQV